MLVAASIGAYVGALTLVAVGIRHIFSLRSLDAGLRIQRVVPDGLVRPVAVAIAIGETGLGVLVLAASGYGEVGVARPAFGALTIVFLAFAAYSLVLTRWRPGVPCGCGGGDAPASGWVVLRAATYAIGAATAWGAPGAVQSIGDAHPGWLTALIGSAIIAFAVILWALPASMRDPNTYRTGPGPAPTRALRVMD